MNAYENLRVAKEPATVSPQRDASLLVLQLATVSVGLFAGLLVAFAIAVMPALAKSDDRVFVLTMRQINRSIQNPVFGLIFAGATLATGATPFLEKRAGRVQAALWAKRAVGAQAVALAVTMAVNIPLNSKLASPKEPLSPQTIADLRNSFEVPWNLANGVRAFASSVAMFLFVKSLIAAGEQRRGL